MKYIFKLLPLILISSIAIADEPNISLPIDGQKSDVFLCPFKETLVIKNAPPGTQILGLSASGLVIEQQGTAQFVIYNIKVPCSNGTASAQIGFDNNNFSKITFHDGPWMFIEIKSVVNQGKFRFSQWNPDFKKHYYELNFVTTDRNTG